MSAHHNNYRDSNFNLNEANGYTLLLQLEATSFSYAVVNSNSLLVYVQDCELSELDNDVLSATYHEVIIGLPATGLSLIPNDLFSEEHLAGFARLLDVKENERVFAQPLDDQNMIIYKTEAVLIPAIEKFNLQNAVYAARGWIKAVANANPPGDKMYLEIGKDLVQILYFLPAVLRFYNAFEFKNEDELVYFTALVAQELGLSPADTSLVLSGNVNNGDKNITRLAEFFAKAELNDISVLQLPDQIESHRFLALAALSLCGSLEVH